MFFSLCLWRGEEREEKREKTRNFFLLALYFFRCLFLSLPLHLQNMGSSVRLREALSAGGPGGTSKDKATADGVLTRTNESSEGRAISPIPCRGGGRGRRRRRRRRPRSR